MKNLTLLILLLSVFSINLYSSEKSAAEMFDKANRLYTEGKFADAVSEYESLISKGYKSKELYYNLGNSYYRLKKVPHAIINFERAKLLSPDDEEINFNLRVANLRTVDKISRVPKFFLTEWFEGLRAQYPSSVWSVIAIIFSWIGFISLAFFLLSRVPVLKKALFAVAVFSIIIAITSAVFASQMDHQEQARNYAIVFEPSIIVKSSPDENGVNLVTLHEGTKVKVIDVLKEWKKIRIADGNVGWVKKSAIEII
jgi:tetratricopeptide (TPR) repeat protein